MKVLITGGCGKCATVLKRLQMDKVFMDISPPVDSMKDEQFLQGDIRDTQFLLKSMIDCTVVIHLAGSTDPEQPWEQNLEHNILGTQTVLKTAAKLGIDKVIYGSSNHVVGMYEIENRPCIYEPGHTIRVDKSALIRPDSFYGVSKASCETLGRFYAENGGPKFYAIRIGAVRTKDDDHPYAYAENGVREGKWTRGSDEYEMQVKRLKAIWQSRRDFLQMVERCIHYEGPVFDLFYGLSNNSTRWLDIEYAKEVLGYSPRDKSDSWEKPPEDIKRDRR